MQWLTSCISTTLVLVLLGLVVFSVLTTRRITDSIRETLVVTLRLKEGITKEETHRLQDTLQACRYTFDVVYVSKDEALQEHTQAMNTDPAEFVGFNPFFATMELKLKADYANTDSLLWVSQELGAMPEVFDVTYPSNLIDELNANVRKVNWMLLGLAALLLFVSFGLINNTVRLHVYSQRFLIHTMKLVGAKWSFIRRPFLSRSLRMGIVASILADGVLLGGIRFLLKLDPALTDYITPFNQLVMAMSVLVMGLLITLLCAYFSVNRYLRMRAGDLYEM